MALLQQRTKADWETTFKEAGIAATDATTYATTFVQQHMTMGALSLLDRATLTEMGVTAVGDALAIIKLGIIRVVVGFTSCVDEMVLQTSFA